MKKISFTFGPNFYSLPNTQVVDVKIASSISPTEPVPEVSADSKPLVIITGRANNHRRKGHLLRLRSDVVSDIKTLVDGPMSLVTELALKHLAQHLRSEKSEGGVVMKASDFD